MENKMKGMKLIHHILYYLYCTIKLHVIDFADAYAIITLKRSKEYFKND